ncbi:maleylpyruvate isomerase family mycothiol-dependent enzyme [Nonomuraea sp. NPDC048882]|uniref:maleylpyruvate isomerase family mycothiol-dependent enzyme n=1 Tax=unclassified Nonomuraea TaxID=2593643 RepID=UPI0033C56BCA
MEAAARLRREARAFGSAARQAAARGGTTLVPSCPAWSMADLVLHLGGVHRFVIVLIRDRLPAPPDLATVARTESPPSMDGWPSMDGTPSAGPIPPTLLDWFDEGVERLVEQFGRHAPDDPAWTWSREQTVGFWLRMQVIEAAVHRWDAENAVGTARPIPPDVAVDAIPQTFEVMAPQRRAWSQAPPGKGESYRFVRTDGPGEWLVRFDGEHVRLADSGPANVEQADGGPADVELAGTASDLMLFLWGRLPADGLDVRGDQAVLDRYFALVPPV